MSETITGASLRPLPTTADQQPENMALRANSVENRIAYCQRRLSGAPVLNLPMDKPRPAIPSDRFASRTKAVGENLADGIRQLAQAEDVPLAVVLLSAFQTLLLRYTSQDDVVIGCSVTEFGSGGDGRFPAEPLAFLLRTELSGDLSFSELVKRVRVRVLEAAEQGSSSLAELVEELTSALGVQAPTFQASFSYASGNAKTEQGLTGPDVPVDLHLLANADGEALSLIIFYNPELFESGSIDRTLGNLETLIQGIVQHPEKRLSDLPILSKKEEQQILVEWNANRQDYPSDRCLHELVEAQAERFPDRSAVIRGSEQLSYREFNQRANQLAHYLRSNGAGRGTKIGICLQPDFDFAIALLAVMKTGAACVPLDSNYPQDRLAYMLQDARASMLITQDGVLTVESPAGCRTLILANLTDELSRQPRTNPASGVTPDDIAYVIYTSGSTGKPRGVLLPHAGLVNYNTVMSRMYDMTPNDRMLQFCSVSFDIAIEEIFTTLLNGAALVMRPADMPLAVPEFVSWAEQQGITILDLPTAYWHEWVHHLPELKKPFPQSLRLVIVGGERASAKAFAEWSKAVGGRVRWVNTYGPTEGSISVTAFEPDYDAQSLPENIPIGRPVPNCHVYLLDQRLNVVPVGVPGELHIGGVGVARGYHNRPELTSDKFIADPFSSNANARLYKTGDMARYLPSGNIEFVGRGDDQVKIRGFRVELGEIEAALAKYPGIREVAVVAREDASGGKRLVAYLVASQAAPTTTELRHYLQQQLPDYMVPSNFVLLEAMPLTPNGKIDRRGLPEPRTEAASQEITAATDAFQVQLVRIWEDVLGRKPIGIRDNFFELGGHSLLAARLMHRIGQALNKTLPLAMLFEAPTVEKLAATLRGDGWSLHWSSLVPIQPAGSHTPFFCIHGVGGNVVGFRELGRRMAPDFPFYGLQSQGLDGKHPSHATIEEMASHYIDEIKSVQPRGPYSVGGFSFGGLVAYEMAQQLRARGEEVGLLILFDTYPGDLKSVTASLVKLVLTPSWQNWFYDLPKAARKRIRRTVQNWKVPRLLNEVRDSNRAAADRYVLRPYSARATLVRAIEQSLRSASDDPHAAWKTLVTDLEIHDVPGSHYEILVEPQVDLLAECLKSCIEKASYSQRPGSVPNQIVANRV